ncbi:uncharacterized protein LOC122138348 [Cyprinus carpio]|uniref:Uncharacterized protein LOC122138348 n=1 Tax=Cyprinus carpio TaxID=7962 RepID=A0A9Q9WMY9_CYPCA|nr:uncharacterized protein LOC122138348 [Cyprinus carpio]
MFRSSSPAVHGGNPSTWLKAVTTPFLPKDASNLQHLNQEQLDTEPDELTAHDPTQSYNYKELARILGSLVHILVTQRREAWKDQARTQSRLDQLLLETQNQPEKEDATDPELQKEVERLQNALQDLRLDTDQRGQLEREAQKELNEKLQQCDTLLERAKTELKERDSKARAYSDHGLLNAMDLKQGRLENPQTFYSQLRKAYFGARNEPGMEQDVNFKTLFLRNLHASWSFHLGVSACPCSMSTQESWDLAHKAYTKQKTISEKTVKNPTIYSVSEHCSELTLEGAPQHHSHRPFYRESRPFQASRGLHNRGGARPKHQSKRYERFWDRRPKKSRSPPSRTQSPDSRQWNHSRHDTDKKDEPPDILCLSIRTETNTLSNCHLTEPSTPNTARHPQTTELTVTSQGDSITQAPQLTAAHPERDSTVPHTRYNNPKVPENAVLATCLRSELHETGPNHPSIVTPAPMPTFLGNLVEKGVGRKLHLNITLGKGVSMEALINTGSDLTVISSQLFKRLQFEAKRQDRTLTPQTCELNVQSYSQNDIRFDKVASIHLTIGPMSLVHPVYISPMDTYPLLIGKDLLDRFEPLLDFKQLKVWAQVRETLPLQPHRSPVTDCQVTEVTGTPTEPDCQVTELTGTPAASHGYTASTTNQGSSSLLCTLVNEQGTVIPAYTKGVAARLNMRCGQTLNHTLGFFQPSPECVELGLTLEATPLTEVSSHIVYILCNNWTVTDINIPKAYRLGWLVSHDFHDFERVRPVIGPIPPALIPEGSTDKTLFTAPFKFIAITSVMSVTKDQVCRTELTEDQHLAVYTVSHQSVSETDEPATPLNTKPTDDTPMEKPYPCFESPVQRILQDANALQSDTVRQGLRQVLYKFKESCAKDSLDCGLTNLHMVHIPTHPDAPPTFVKQYKIPIASHEPVQEMIESMLEKGVIRPRNSTYSAPIWPVLKPNGE